MCHRVGPCVDRGCPERGRIERRRVELNAWNANDASNVNRGASCYLFAWKQPLDGPEIYATKIEGSARRSETIALTHNSGSDARQQQNRRPKSQGTTTTMPFDYWPSGSVAPVDCKRNRKARVQSVSVRRQ